MKYIPIPELILYAIISQWAEVIRQEGLQPNLAFMGIDNDTLATFKNNFKDLKVGFIYPQTETELPSITLTTEALTPAEIPLGYISDYQNDEGEITESKGVMLRADVRIFVVTNNPETTILLANYLYGYLLTQIDTILSLGLLEPEISMSVISPWTQVLPNIGFRRELMFTCLFEMSAPLITPPATNIKVQVVDKKGNVIVEW